MKWLGYNQDNSKRRNIGGEVEISKIEGRSTLELSSWSTTADAANAGRVKFLKSGTAALDTYTAGDHTTAGEILGRIEAYGVDDADGETLSSYIEFANDAVSDADSSPGQIRFATSDADDAGTPTVRMLIDDGGMVSVQNGTLRQTATTNASIQSICTKASSSDVSGGGNDSGGRLHLREDDGATMGNAHRLGVIEFAGAEDSSGTIRVGARIDAITDATWSASENGASLKFYTTDGNNSQSVALTLNSDNLATFAGAINLDSVSVSAVQTSSESFSDNDTSIMTSAAIADKIEAYNYSTESGDITGVTAGTGLSGGGTSGAVTLNVDAAQSGITSLGTLTGLTLDGNKNVTPGDGAMIHVDANDITDNATSEEGTAAKYTHVNIEAPRLLATNETVTTTDAATLYVQAAPSANTNQTITNAWALWVDAGNVRLDGNLTFDSVALSAIQTSGESFADNDTSIMTSAAIDDAIVKGGSVTYINILPHEFLADEGGGANKSAQYDDTDGGGGTVDIGVSVGSTSASLFAFVDIPVGKTATHVTVFGSNTGNAITVYESNVKTGTLTSKGSGSTDSGDDSNIIDITDVVGSSTNYLVIKSAIAAITNTIWGAQVTVSG